MARFWNREEQVDPFNAGEPVLPWDDPSTAHETEGENCAFSDDEPYDGPTKERDHYDAPSSRNAAKASKRSKAKSGRKRKASGSAPVDNLQELFGEVLDTMTEGESSTDAGSSPYEVEMPTAKSRAAARAEKAGKTGKKKKSVALTTIKWIFFAIILTNLIPVFIGVVDILIEDIFGPDIESEYSYDGPEEPDFSDDAAEEQACRDTLGAAFNQALMSEGLAHPMLVQSLNESLLSSIGYTPEELGIDPNTYASWFLSNMTFNVSSVYVYDDGTASAYFDAWGPKDYLVQSEAYDSIWDYLYDEGLLNSDEMVSLTPEQQAAVQEIFDQVLNVSVTDNDSFLSVELEKVDGTWTIDEEEFAEELAQALGI